MSTGIVRGLPEDGAQAPVIMPPIRVLLAEDEPHLGTILEQFLGARGFSVTMVRDGAAALERLRAELFDVALLDITMPKVNGLDVLRAVRQDPFPPEIIIITGNGALETAISALKSGAYDFLTKPYRMAEIEALVRRAWEKRVLTRDNARLQSRLAQAQAASKFVTQYAPLTAVLGLVQRVASSASPVLISGECGTGKLLVARLLHSQGVHAQRPFIEVNCATLVESTFETELLGVERGAFPGAIESRMGFLELAAGGTLLLRDIDQLSLRLQGVLLRLLDAGTFVRVGGVQKIDYVVRVVATSSRDLQQLAAAGRFRDDLLQRINTVRIALPPLRDRVVDIGLLAEHFVSLFGGANARRLTEASRVALEHYRWPGNVSELRNVIERAVLLANDDIVEVRDLPTAFDLSSDARPSPSAPLTLSELERRHIQEVLD
ncbi:MAG: sigma-54 dependent transcriptional regulator, partial [Gemmatimonadota bacterium]|nr:sigma-54 dependent transcriptional regulator [Gemmatimonadota bacterium]